MDGFVGVHRPIHAFYITQPYVPASSVTKTIEPQVSHSIKHHSSTTVVTTHAVSTLSSNSVATSKSSTFAVSSVSSSSNTFSRSPPFVDEPTLIVKNHQQVHDIQSKDHTWLAPVLGLVGVLSILGVALLFFLCKRRRHRHSNNNNKNMKRLPASHESWASISTIQTSMLEGGDDLKKMAPAYHHFPKAQKRLTADTLVEEPSVLMLKNQYSPQLAFSPSLVAGEFQQQQQQQQPPLPIISPSNTLIDNAGILNEEKQENGRRRIEIYDPQVNLQNHGPFDTPYSYSNDQERKY